MVRKLLLLATSISCLHAAAQDPAVVVRFATGSTTLDADAVQALAGLCAAAEGRTLTISGHSDDRGSTALNERLSFERAAQVREHLARTCPSLVLRETIGQGGSFPIASNGTEAGRTLNRRVEVAMDPLPPTPCTDHYDPLTDHHHAHVTPLMPGADKPRELHVVDASAPIQARMSDGTIVRLPADAFVDAQGRPITGSVDLTYRAFLDPWEVIASGIPMHAADNGSTAHFETAGMYEVYASQNGRPLQLRPGAQIGLETQGPEVTPDYGAFVLDKVTGEWRVGGAIANTRAMPTMAVQTFMLNLDGMPSLPDSLTFQQRQASPKYCYTTACEDAKRPYRYDEGAYRSPYTQPDIPAIRLNVDRSYWKEHRAIAFTVEAPYRRHPEWRSFKHTKRWIYTGTLDPATFRRTVSRKHFYQDIALLADAGATEATLRVKDRGEWLELPVRLADPYDERTSEDLDEALGLYNTRLSTKTTRFDRRTAAELTRVKGQRDRIRIGAHAAAIPHMDPEERAMDRAAFEAYAMAALAPYGRPGFTMEELGTWNCDRFMPMQMETVVEVLAEDGTPLKWKKAFGVPDGSRAVVTYWNRDGNARQRMRVDLGGERIVFVGADNALHVAVVTAVMRFETGSLVLRTKPFQQPDGPEALSTLAAMP